MQVTAGIFVSCFNNFTFSGICNVCTNPSVCQEEMLDQPTLGDTHVAMFLKPICGLEIMRILNLGRHQWGLAV